MSVSKNLFVLLLLGGMLVLSACQPATDSDSTSLSVVTTIFPFQEFASAVGGEHVLVKMLLPPGAEPHSYDPKPSDILATSDADVFFFVGEGMSPWAHDILQGVDNPSLTVIKAADFVELIGGADHGHDDEHPDDNHVDEESIGDDHVDEVADNHADDEHAYDPHVWLSMHNNILIVQRLADEFSRLDPVNAVEYQANADAYIARLRELDAGYAATLATCAKDEFISGGHDIFGYLEHEYGIHGIEAIENLEPHTEPTPARLAQLSDLVEEHDIKYVLTEVLVSARVADAIAQQTGAQVLVFNPASNLPKEQFEQGKTFIGLMDDNLKTLSLALECS